MVICCFVVYGSLPQMCFIVKHERHIFVCRQSILCLYTLWRVTILYSMSGYHCKTDHCVWLHSNEKAWHTKTPTHTCLRPCSCMIDRSTRIIICSPTQKLWYENQSQSSLMLQITASWFKIAIVFRQLHALMICKQILNQMFKF